MRCELPTDGHSAHTGPGLSRRHSAIPTPSFLDPSLWSQWRSLLTSPSLLGGILASELPRDREDLRRAVVAGADEEVWAKEGGCAVAEISASVVTVKVAGE